MPDLLAPLRALVSLLLSSLHAVVVLAGPSAGPAWLLAVVLLVVVVRAAMLPLAVRQLRTGGRLRDLAPDLQRIRDRAGTGPGSRERIARETADLYRERGVHPLASVLPLLVQIPVFVALLQALQQAAHGSGGPALASFATAAVLGAPLAATALSGGVPGAVLGGAMLAVTAAAQMVTQHLTAAPSPFAPVLLALPLVTAATGLLLPVGVTAYWCASALWTLGQQVLLVRVLRIG